MTFVHVAHIESFSKSLLSYRFVLRRCEIGVMEKNQGGTAEFFVPCMFRHTRDFFVTSEKSRNVFKVRLEVYLRILF